MSPLPTSPDLARLRDEGYDITGAGSLLVVRHVPYVDSDRNVQLGTLTTELNMSGDVLSTPATHVMKFSGSAPCDRDGNQLVKVIHSKIAEQLDDGTTLSYLFSSKPLSGSYPSYYDMVTTYVALLMSPARALDPTATAQTFPVVETEDDESVFRYLDTASSRAGIRAAVHRFEGHRVAIVGLGGTGAHILDLIAKVPVQEIHLYDGDRFQQHNAFRSPGAASIEELRERPYKVDRLAAVYDRLRRNVVPHTVYVDKSNVDELKEMDFVFISLDRAEARRLVVEALEAHGIPFVDVGMGLYLTDDGALSGLLRVTASTPQQRNHVHGKGRIPFGDGLDDNEYTRNIQTVELNSVNAALAVIKWKKLFGFYLDLENEHHSVYQLDGNVITNEDQA